MSMRQMLFVAVTTGLVSVNAGGITEQLSGGHSAAYGEEKPARDAVVTGKVKAVDADKKTITLASKETDGGKVTPEQTFTLGDGLKVTVNGKAGKLEDVKAKMDVQLLLTADKKSVTEIRTRIGEGGGEKPERPLKGFRGEVSKVDDKSITVVQRGDSGARSETFSLEGAKILVETNEDVIIKGDGGREVARPKTVEGKLSDIKAGQIVTLSIKADKLTTVTVARQKKGEEKKGEK